MAMNTYFSISLSSHFDRCIVHTKYMFIFAFFPKLTDNRYVYASVF